jgi:hypothetical protein
MVTVKKEGNDAMAKVHKDTEEYLCRNIVATGTRFVSKECHTAFEWRNISSDAQDFLAYMGRANELQFAGH